MEICTSYSIAEAMKRLEGVAREYSLAVIEGNERGEDYPDAGENLRFINDLIFDMKCTIEDKNRLKKIKHDNNEQTRNISKHTRKS